GKCAGVCRDASSSRYGFGGRDRGEKSAHALTTARHFTHLTFEDLRGRELLELQMTHRSVEQDSLRHQPDDLAPCDLGPFGLGPQVGWILAGPKSGLRAGFFPTSSRSPSNSPRRTSARFSRAGLVAARSYR